MSATSAMMTRKNLVVARPNQAARVVLVRAAHNANAETSSRRQMMGKLAGVAALFAGAGSAAAAPISLIDDKDKKMDYKENIADLARNVDIDNKIRNGTKAAAEDKDFTIKRVQEGKKRLEGDVKTFVDKQFWYDAKQELRRQLGYMSVDMNTLIATSKDKKAATSLKKDFFTSIDNLDFAIRKKDRESGLKYQAEAVAKLNDFIAFAT